MTKKKTADKPQSIFQVADTVVLLHIYEVWDYGPKDIVVCKVPTLKYAPPHSYCKWSQDGWAGAGLYAAAPAYNWVKAYRKHLEIPEDNIYARVMAGRAADPWKGDEDDEPETGAAPCNTD